MGFPWLFVLDRNVTRVAVAHIALWLLFLRVSPMSNESVYISISSHFTIVHIFADYTWLLNSGILILRILVDHDFAGITFNYGVELTPWLRPWDHDGSLIRETRKSTPLPKVTWNCLWTSGPQMNQSIAQVASCFCHAIAEVFTACISHEFFLSFSWWPSASNQRNEDRGRNLHVSYLSS